MSTLFKHKKSVWMVGGKQVRAGTPKAKKTVIPSTKWYARVRFEDGKLKNVPLSPDQRSS
jgi:hypothetical protein